MLKNKLKQFLILFIIGFVSYICLEVFFGSSSGAFFKEAFCLDKSYWSLMGMSSMWMGLVGGITFISLGLINENKFIRFKVPYILQFILGGLIITGYELLSGIILNLGLGLNIWDYSTRFWNFLGQINLYTSIIWFIISPFGFWLDDLIRNLFKCRWFGTKSLGTYYLNVILNKHPWK